MTGREFGFDLGASEQVDCQCCLWNELAPGVQRPIGIRAIQDGNEVGFESLHCSFGQVSSMHAGVDQLAVKVLGSDTGDECIGDFIVQAMKDWFDSCINEALAACITPLVQVVCPSALDRLSWNCI